MKSLFFGLFAGCLVAAGSVAHADILVLSNGRYADGKIVSTTDSEVVFKLDGAAAADEPKHVERSAISRIIYCDETGAVEAAPTASTDTKPAAPAKPRWDVPAEPAAPPIATTSGDTYYLIPLHGEVRATVLASALEKSLADAVRRKPSVIILDIDSPGGLVDESLKIMKVIAHYNKQAKIVAFIEQDLSAAAIFTLSVKTIYVKQLSTIGAATSFIPGRPNLSAKVEEKMQSVWRAAARNSAEEGGHDPLLADAMIDNDTELHVETVDGKPVIKEGAGDHMLVKKGKILTLTSHEAVACGVAAGEADDLSELCTALGFKNWTECKGLGTVLADFLPKQQEAFQAAMDKVGADFGANLDAAVRFDPSGAQQFVEVTQRRVVPGPVMRGPLGPRTYVPGRQAPNLPQNQIIERRIITTTNPGEWKGKTLACTVALQAAEANMNDAVEVCQLFGHDDDTAPMKEMKGKLAALREKVFKDRNKYLSQPQAPAARPAPPIASSPAPANRPRTVPQLAALAADPDAKAPNPDDSAEKLKKINDGWQTQKSTPMSLLASVKGILAKRNGDGSLLIPSGGVVASPEFYGPPVTFRVVLLTSGKQVRINCGGSAIFFNSTMHPGELRLYAGPANEKHKSGAGTLAKDQWVGLEFTVTQGEMIIRVDGVEQYRFQGDYSKIHQQFAVRADNGDIWVKSIDVIQPKDAAP